MVGADGPDRSRREGRCLRARRAADRAGSRGRRRGRVLRGGHGRGTRAQGRRRARAHPGHVPVAARLCRRSGAPRDRGRGRRSRPAGHARGQRRASRRGHRSAPSPGHRVRGRDRARPGRVPARGGPRGGQGRGGLAGRPADRPVDPPPGDRGRGHHDGPARPVRGGRGGPAGRRRSAFPGATSPRAAAS